jgi:hypothetical protein
MSEPLLSPTPGDAAPAPDPLPPSATPAPAPPPPAADDLDALRLGPEDLAAALAGQASAAREGPRLDNPRRGRRLVKKTDPKALALTPPARTWANRCRTRHLPASRPERHWQAP